MEGWEGAGGETVSHWQIMMRGFSTLLEALRLCTLAQKSHKADRGRQSPSRTVTCSQLPDN